VAAVLLPFVVFAVVDRGLGLVGLVPPEDPLVFHARTYEEDFTPFARSPEGDLTIRSDWINEGNDLRVRRGTGEGRFFVFPGFRSVRFPESKPAGTKRIFVVGGSSVFGLYVGEDEAFVGQLEAGLTERYPEHRFEVLNLGCPGWASNRILNLLPALLRLEPDLVLVYAGHNELLRGAVDRGPGLGKLGRIDETMLSVSNLYGWLHHAVASWSRGAKDPGRVEDLAAVEAGEILVYEPLIVPVEDRPPLDDVIVHLAAERFRDHVAGMAARCREAGVPILFTVPVANLLRPPAVTAGAHLEDDRAADSGPVSRGFTAMEAERFPEALRWLDEAIGASPEDAGLYYWRGLSHAQIGNRSAAISDLQTAVDRDVRTHRITSSLERAIFEGARSAGAPVVDLRPVLRRTISPERAKELFVDHCHPTPEGHRLLAGELLPHVAELLGL
jgi:lysophospholipase L1-like esterase